MVNDDTNDDSGSVTHWIESVRAGDSEAALPLWRRYFGQLVQLMRARFPLLRTAGSFEDEEDAALSAFNSVCLGLVDGRFPDLSDRDDLWHLLVLVTSRKALDQIERLGRQKRGGRTLVRESKLSSGQEALGRKSGWKVAIKCLVRKCRHTLGSCHFKQK